MTVYCTQVEQLINGDFCTLDNFVLRRLLGMVMCNFNILNFTNL